MYIALTGRCITHVRDLKKPPELICVSTLERAGSCVTCMHVFSHLYFQLRCKNRPNIPNSQGAFVFIQSNVVTITAPLKHDIKTCMSRTEHVHTLTNFIRSAFKTTRHPKSRKTYSSSRTPTTSLQKSYRQIICGNGIIITIIRWHGIQPGPPRCEQ